MPFWPFKSKKRRRDSVGKEKETAFDPLLDSEKVDCPPTPPPRKRGLAAVAAPPPPPASPIPIPRRSSKRPSPLPLDSDTEIESLPDPLIEKENVPPPRSPRPIISKESITALPMAYKLQYSPHLRPVDSERPHIPYNFRTQSGSLVGAPPQTPTSQKATVIRKPRSSYEAATPQRTRSSRTKKDEQIREEEIRAMSAQSPIPKRPGEGPLRRDSKKMRSGMLRGSEISLPVHEESVHESMPGIMEQRGWVIGAIDLFNPRPAVRLSGVPQYVSPQSPRTATPTSPRPMSKNGKRPVTRESGRKRDTIGNRADDLDSNDIRTLLERDAKRRAERKKEQQEKLDRKLRKREGRNRGDSDRRKREAEDRKRAEEEAFDLQALTPPVPDRLHPTLHTPELEAAAVGLGIAAGAGAATEDALDKPAVATHDISPLEEMDSTPFIHDVSPLEEPDQNPFTHDVSPLEQSDENPFSDPAEIGAVRPSVERMPSSYAPSETPMDDDDAVIVETAQAVAISQASTPPLSPMHSMRAASSLSRIAADSRRASDIPTPTQASDSRRASQPAPERKTGALASLFRRSAAQPKKGFETNLSPSEVSFSNTSRESMRGQPLPAHLVDTQPRVAAVRSASGTPSRTQSKFREDLPEFPISPPDSRNASPDVTPAVAAARRAQITSQYVDAQRQGSTTTSGSEPVTTRYDTPVSPSLRPGTSLASVDSEGAWLASGNMKRQSRQSGLNTRKAEFSSSYEEIGIDADAQHFSQGGTTSEVARGKQRADSSSGMLGASETTSATEFHDATEDLESPSIPMTAEPGTPTVHGSVRRRPTLVKTDSRHRSREGLVSDSAIADATVSPGGDDDNEPASAATTGRGSLDMDSDPEAPEPQVQRATSVRVGHHGRNVSTGSAKLLSVAAPAQRVAGVPEDGSEGASPMPSPVHAPDV